MPPMPLAEQLEEEVDAAPGLAMMHHQHALGGAAGPAQGAVPGAGPGSGVAAAIGAGMSQAGAGTSGAAERQLPLLPLQHQQLLQPLPAQRTGRLDEAAVATAAAPPVSATPPEAPSSPGPATPKQRLSASALGSTSGSEVAVHAAQQLRLEQQLQQQLPPLAPPTPVPSMPEPLSTPSMPPSGAAVSTGSNNMGSGTASEEGEGAMPHLPVLPQRTGSRPLFKALLREVGVMAGAAVAQAPAGPGSIIGPSGAAATGEVTGIGGKGVGAGALGREYGGEESAHYSNAAVTIAVEPAGAPVGGVSNGWALDLQPH